jgi:hypothetical protein
VSPGDGEALIFFVMGAVVLADIKLKFFQIGGECP